VLALEEAGITVELEFEERAGEYGIARRGAVGVGRLVFLAVESTLGLGTAGMDLLV